MYMILKIKFENHDKYVLTCLVIRQFLMIIWMREVRTHPNFTRFVGQNTLKPVWICSTFSPSPRKYLLVVPRKYLLLVQCLTRMRYIYIIADLVAWITMITERIVYVHNSICAFIVFLIIPQGIFYLLWDIHIKGIVKCMYRGH